MILTRYLGREVFHTFIALIIILLIVLVSTMFIKLLSSAAAGGLTSSAIITLLGLGLPQYFAILLPICLFFAIIIAYGRMFADNELLVMFACGMSWKKLLRITFFPAVLIALVVAALTLYLVPKVLFYQYSLQTQAGQKENLSLVQPGRFLPFNNGNQILYVSKAGPDKTYQDIFGYDRSNDSSGQPSILTAPNAYVRQGKKPDEQYLILLNGYQYTGTPGQLDYRIVHFKQYSVRLLSDSLAWGSSNIQVESTLDLLRSDSTAARAEFQWRMTIPIVAIVFSILAVALCHVKPRQGRYAKLLPSVLVFIIYFNLVSVVHSLLRHDNAPWYLNIWEIHIVFLVIGLGMLWWANGRRWVREL